MRWPSAPCFVTNQKPPSYTLSILQGKEKEIHLVEKKSPYGVLVEKPKGDRLEYVGLDGRILTWVLKEYDRSAYNG
jgi:hypothetical protein